MFKLNRILIGLSSIIVLLVLVVTAGAWLLPIYTDNPTITLMWRINDFITLAVALPLWIVAAVIWFKKKSLKALLVWYGVVWYICYNYAYYVYGAHFNAFYLLYLLIYSLSLLAVIVGVIQLPIQQIQIEIKPIWKKTLIGIMGFIATGLLLIYTIQSLLYVMEGTLPAIITMSGHITSVVFSIDVSMVVLVFMVSIYLMIKNNKFGYVFALIGNLKGAIYLLVLIFSSIQINPEELIIWVMLFILSCVALGLSYRSIKPIQLK